MIRAKFLVQEVTKRVNQDGTFDATNVKMRAVYGREGTENATWSKYTPSGELTMSITNPAAEDAFRPGQEYYIDFTLVPVLDKS